MKMHTKGSSNKKAATHIHHCGLPEPYDSGLPEQYACRALGSFSVTCPIRKATAGVLLKRITTLVYTTYCVKSSGEVPDVCSLKTGE